MGRTNQVGSHKTFILTEHGTTKVVYHNTPVVEFNFSEIILNTGGYKSFTTKTRMNQASSQFDLGYHVYQEKHVWYVDYNGETFVFKGDTITLKRGLKCRT